MAALLAQAASSAEWHQGWQLAVAASSVVILLVGWFYRILKADINRLDHRINRLEAKIDNLQQLILQDALERARLQQAAPSQATPTDAPQPVASQSEAVATPQARVSDLGFIAPTAEHSEKQ